MAQNDLLISWFLGSPKYPTQKVTPLLLITLNMLLTAQCRLPCPVTIPVILHIFPFCIWNPVYQQPIPTPSSSLAHTHRARLITFIGEPKFSRKHRQLRLSWQHNCPHAVFVAYTHTQNEVNYSNALDMCFPPGEIRFGGVSVRAYSWGINKCSLKPVWERQKDPPTPPTITIMFFIPLHVLTLNMSRGRLALLFLTHFHPSYTHVQKEVVREGLTSTSCIWSLWIKE